MSCSACGHDSRSGARFCEGCGVGLPQPCASCGVELSPGARFCGACGAPAAGPAEPTAARKVVSVVFGDLVGSTALQEKLDPESARRVMARFYDVMRAVIARHDGHLDKFVGDGVVAVFGVRSVGEDDALRAVRCAAAMVADLAALGEELERDWDLRLAMRTGVNTGELVISGEGELVGDAMNTAARLEQAASAGNVLIGEATWRLVRHAVQLEPVEPLALKGKAEPVRAWRVLAAEPAPGEPASGRVDAPLVGRTAELTRLRGVLDEAVAARSCRLVTVIGSPGMGKTRLAEEFSLAVGSVASVVQGRCEPSGEGITFLPVAEMLRGAGGIGEGDTPETVRAKLVALVEGEHDADRIVARAGSLLGAADPASVQETFWGVRRVLEALARRRPLVVVLDDVHWGQPLFLDLVEHLVEWVRDAPMLLLALARPELRESREVLTVPGRRASEVIDLVPLAATESRAFVDGMLGRADLPPDLLDRILDTTEGNPLFLGETLRMLVDEGSLTRRGETWVTAGAGVVAVPPTIQQLLSARIERLQHEERAVVERAAVIGKQFYRGAVAELVAPGVRSGLDGHLETLRRKEMVEPDGTYWVDEPVYRFHHVLIRDAAYALLLKEARAELHERFADWLTGKAGELVGEHEEVIAYHLEQAHEYRRQLGRLDDRSRDLGTRAAILLQSVGQRALARADLAAATNLLARARERTPDEDPELLWDLAEALLSAGDTTAAREVVDALAALAGQGRQLQARADVLGGQISMLTGATAPEAVVEQLTAAAEVLTAIGDGSGAAKAHHVAAQAHAQLGRLGAAEAALDRALVAARRAGDGRRITAVLAAAPRAALWGPSPVVRASGRCLDVLRILRMTAGNRHVEAIALRCQAVLEATRGRFDPAREILGTARTTLQELGLTLELHELATHAGMVELLAGDPAAAQAQLRQARDGFTALGLGVGAAQAAALLARALVEQGRDDEALEQTRFAEEHAGGDLKATITWCGARAEALVRQGDHDEALALAHRAVALAEPTDALPDKADAAMTLARVLGAIGLPDDARAAARQALELYRAKDHAVGIARATELTGLRALADPRPATPAPTEQPTVLGDRPPERVFAEICRTWVGRDLDEIADRYAADVVRVDHRIVGWEEARGRDVMRENIRSLLRMSPDLRVEPDEVLACDDHVLAVRATVRGTGADGTGEFELAAGFLLVTADGRVQRMEQFDHDDTAAILARYGELAGRRDVLGDRPSERMIAEWIRRFNAHDIDGIVELHADDYMRIDHRSLGWEELRNEDIRSLHESFFASSADLRVEIDEVLACDDRVIAFTVAVSGTHVEGGGAFEIGFGVVAVIENGRRSREDVYEPEDRQAMLIRFAELGGGQGRLGDRPLERLCAEWARRWARGDVDRLMELCADDLVMIDHRVLVLEARRRDKGNMRQEWESFLAAASDWWWEVDEVLACDDRVMANLGTFHGTSKDGGGRFEIAIGFVNVVEDGLFERIEMFEPEDRQAMLARYAELGGQGPARPMRLAEQVEAEYPRRFAEGDLDGILELYADDFVAIDHRTLSWEELRKNDLRALHESFFAVTSDLRFTIDEVLACDDRVIAVRVAMGGTHVEGGGSFELPVGVVLVIENGLRSREDYYEPEDRQAMLARFAELGGGQGLLGDGPPERFYAEFCRRLARRDVDRLMELYADDCVQIDHRALGWEELHKDAVRPTFDSFYAAGSDWWCEVDEVLACDDRVIAISITMHGTSNDGGGRFEIAFGIIDVIEHGLLGRAEVYQPEDRQAMLARYAELAGKSPIRTLRLSEQMIAEYMRCFAERDLDSVLDLYTADYVGVDHRAVGWEELRNEDMRSVHESFFAVASGVRFATDDVLACDDRVIAFTLTVSGTHVEGGGAFEIGFGSVAVIENGRRAREDIYEPEDRQAMLVRFAELGGGQGLLGDRPPERVFAEFCRRWARRDVDSLLELYADDCVHIDHRVVGWEELRKDDGVRPMLESFLAAASDWWWEVDEVLGCDDRVIAISITMHGTSNDGGGRFEIAYGLVDVIEDGLFRRVDIYEPEDRQAMLARYAELGGHGPIRTVRPPEQAMAEYHRRWAERDIDGLLELYAADAVVVDHRVVGWGETRKEDIRPRYESFFAVASDLRLATDEVLACDDRVIAFIQTASGTHLEGGGAFEISFGTVAVVENGRRSREDLYEPEDRQAMLVRFAELGGGQGLLGDRPPERFLAELARRWARCDAGLMEQLYTDEFVGIDHRALGWEELDKDGMRPLLESFYAAGSDWWLGIDEVLGCDDRAIAVLFNCHGTSNDGGGPVEIAYGVVFVVEDGLASRYDQYEYDDRQGMLARFAELTGGPAELLGDRPPERLFAEFARRVAVRDVEGMLDLYAEDHVLVDHRSLGWDDLDKESNRGLFESMFAAGSDIRWEVDEVLACDARVIAMSLTIRGTSNDGGGPFEIPYGIVAVIEDGRLSRADQYEYDERQAMIVRFAELGGGLGRLGDRPPERFMAELAPLWALGDIDRLLEHFADDFVQIDHRALGWEETPKDSLRPFWESFFAAGSDWSFEVDEVLACDDRVIAFRCSIPGTNNDGGGRFEIAYGAVVVVAEGLASRWEQYEYDDRQAMLVRFAELGGGLGALGDRPPERWLAEWARREAQRDVDRLLELYADELVMVDHRALGWEDLDKDGMRPLHESFFAACSDWWFEVDEVLACDDRVSAHLATLHGTNNDGGGRFEIASGYVAVIEDGKAVRFDQYEYDDREAMLARFAELTGEREDAAGGGPR